VNAQQTAPEHSAATHSYAPDKRNADVLIGIRNGVTQRFNLQWRPAAKVSVLDSGFLLGDGVWEGIRVHKGCLLLLWVRYPSRHGLLVKLWPGKPVRYEQGGRQNVALGTCYVQMFTAMRNRLLKSRCMALPGRRIYRHDRCSGEGITRPLATCILLRSSPSNFSRVAS
jgi:hypothetical protein